MIGATWLDLQLISGGWPRMTWALAGDAAARNPHLEPGGHVAQSAVGAMPEHRSVADIYWRRVMLTSGRYAMLDDGMGYMTSVV